MTSCRGTAPVSTETRNLPEPATRCGSIGAFQYVIQFLSFLPPPQCWNATPGRNVT
jgi:hypothetical protein